jgi:hypothetical protein
MAQTQILVRVRDISKDEYGQPTLLNGTERTITYKSFRDTLDKFELIAQVDENDKPIPGNPNLHPEFQVQAKQPSAAHADEVRVENAPASEIKPERRKPGPKRKQVTEIEEHVA